MRILGRLHAERAEERDMLGGVAQMIFTANDVRDAHLQIVHDVDEVEHRLTVAPDEHPIGINFLAVGERPQHIANDEVGNENRLARHAEFNRAVGVFVGEIA